VCVCLCVCVYVCVCVSILISTLEGRRGERMEHEDTIVILITIVQIWNFIWWGNFLIVADLEHHIGVDIDPK